MKNHSVNRFDFVLIRLNLSD